MRAAALVLLLILAGAVAGISTAQAQTVTYNSVQLSWTASGDDSLTGTAARYDLRYSTSAITAANFAGATPWATTPTPTAAGTHQSVTVTGLQPNTTYWFAIKSGDEVPNWSGVSNIISRTTLTAPDTIRPAQLANVAVTGSTETTVGLRWNAVGDDDRTGVAASYDVRYSRSPITEARWASATRVSGEPVPRAAGTIQSLTVTGLTRETIYYFAVKVTDDAGNVSAISNLVGATTSDLTPPSAIRDLAVVP